VILRLARPLDQLKPHYDVVVVGSGYGGGVAASRLARAGKQIAVLERGREFQPGEFPTKFPELRSEMQVTGKRLRIGGPAALYDVRLGEDMHVLVGCGLGGGSLINAGVALRPDPRVFQDSVWPNRVREDGLLDEGFSRAICWMRPARDPRVVELSKYQALCATGKALGRAPVATPVTINFEATVNAAGIAQPACTRCGDCCAGCNTGAKNSVAATYLPDALRHGAEIFTHANVRSVIKTDSGTWLVHFDRQDGKESGHCRRSVSASTVILSAGTLGSTEILLRSRDDGLALSRRLGAGFSANGDVIAFGYGGKLPVNAIGVGNPARIDGLVVGATTSGQVEVVDDAELSRSFNIQEGALPSALAPILPVLFIPNGRLLGALQSLIKGVYKGPFAGLQTFFGVGHDSGTGTLAMDGERVSVRWPNAADEPVYARVDAALDALAQRAGGHYVKNPLAGTMMGHQPLTAHPLGGCGIGHDSSDGVVNHKCQVFAGDAGVSSGEVHEGLYVIDGSIMPRSLGVNPLLTITALAERAMIHLARDHGLSFDVAPAGPALRVA
jgi:cholesterol oxidase